MSHTQSPRRRLGALATLAALAALALSIGFCGAPMAAADEIVDDPPVLATAAVLDGKPVDGIPAGPMVAGGYHVHSHLTLYINGMEQWVPAGVGVTRPVVLDPTRPDPSITEAHSFYWLHTHDESGVIHEEAPTPHDFTLGQFFDLWGQPLDRHEVGPAQGDVTVWVDGKSYDGDPRAVALKDHTTVQLNVGRDVPFVPYDFPTRYN
ncbi:hypothetical protein ABH935_008033 [Catenulispora sp. GAS73]|uniref:hypothetical protein n=1 Tax=Catenulispora sp. GAS73 TaxID=3156269 RepID=UPI003511E080